MNPAWSKREFEEKLRAKGARYHIHHPFHRLLHTGRLESPLATRSLAAFRFSAVSEP